jgi:uncharacterized protein (UPF0261 family)
MPTVAVSNSSVVVAEQGVTAACLVEALRVLEAAGCEVIVFSATGSGGQALESSVSEGQVAGVLDLTMTELADELVGGLCSAGPDRLTAAAFRGVPQVIAPGAVDMVNFGPLATVPEKIRGQRSYSLDPVRTLLRTTAEQNDQLGREIALKASAARGPVAVLLPLRGVSVLDKEGQMFWWPEADAALFQSIRNWISPQVRLIELDLHFNDLHFARRAAGVLLEMLWKG